MFRFAASYVVAFYVFPFVSSLVGLRSLYTGRLIPWVGQSLFGLPALRVPSGGCGDRANDYLEVLVSGVAALAVSALWTLLDRRRGGYERLAYWLTTVVRYYLGYQMLQYGLIKILKSQFPFPTPSTLVSTFGESSPMDVMWAFMGYSTAYNMFLGLSEALGGVLLLFRRTTTLGALITSGVMLNVFLLNVCYGVCVKLMSAHLLLMATALAAPDGRRLLDVLLLNRAVAPRDVSRPPFSRRVVFALNIGKWLLIAGALGLSSSIAWRNWHLVGTPAPRSPLQGIWEVASSTASGQGGSAEQTHARGWKLLAIDSPTVAVARRTDDTAEHFVLQIDDVPKTMTFVSPEDGKRRATLDYEQSSPHELALTGDLGGERLSLRLQRRDMNDLPLINHPFRWTSDLPASGER
jgi:uncharacterized membrane protein YphA (DoxX/SURF4 family)